MCSQVCGQRRVGNGTAARDAHCVYMRTLLICAFAAALGACGPTSDNSSEAPAQDQPGPAAESNLPPPEPIPRDENAGRSGLDGMTWIYGPPGQNEPGRPATLLYSARASDETLLAMHCDGANVRIILMRGEGVTSPYPITLKSGPNTLNVTGATSGSGETRVEAIVVRTTPVFTRFSESGVFSLVEQGDEFPANAINDAERQQIRSFFAACP